MTNQTSFAPLSEDVLQSLRNEVLTINPVHVATCAASTLPVASSEAGVDIAGDIGSLCTLADAFYRHASLVGVRLADERITVKKLRLWRDQLFMVRTFLTKHVQSFLSRYAHEGQINLKPEKIVEEAKYIVGRGSTVKFLRSLHSNLFDACEQNRCLDIYEKDRCRDCEQVLDLLNEEIDGLIDRRSEEEEE
jgi:hypothetical protein